MAFEELKANFRRPHVVILGAGTSVAALPRGDANGACLPVMLDLVETVGLGRILDDAGIHWRGRNFESVYQEIAAVPALASTREKVEESVMAYFGSLKLPEEPTIYDYLVLSLREKDVVATFNWDPFLFSACLRNRAVARMPQVLFLHGCAAIGYCEEHSKQGPVDARCSKCRRQFTPTKLLYPIKDKNYTSDPYINSQWRVIGKALQAAFVLTVFGYSAPESDAAAIKLMSDAWGNAYQRNLEETEIIDIKPEDHLARQWDRFIHTHHYRTTDDYFRSLLSYFPRRSCEAIWAETQEMQDLEYSSVPRFYSLKELHDWFGALLPFEQDSI
jgi:hypothetical protein